MTWSGISPGLAGIVLALAAALAGAPAPADAKGRSGKDGSGASGKSGKSQAGQRHSGRHSGRHRHRSEHAEFYWPPAFWPWWDHLAYPEIPTAPIPVQYVERSEQEAQPADHWLYCAKTQGYFPYVGECPGGWERVPSAPLK
jgi:hypothetical protein